MIFNFKNLLLLNIIFGFWFGSVFAMDIAITVDDLPLSGSLPPDMTRTDIARKMIKTFEKHHIKGVYGLINGSHATDPEGLNILKEWIEAGHLLGNHTFSHVDLAKTDSQSYIDGIIKNEPTLENLMGQNDYRYFRYPFLSEGDTQERRDSVRQFLFDHNYKIAPVTVDFFEYEWVEPYTRCLLQKDKKSIAWLQKTYLEQAENALTIAHELSIMLFGRDIKNVLLIHINAISTDLLDELLTLYEKHGVHFISLSQAVSDDVYKINPNVVRERAYTFLNQVRLSRNLPNPEIVSKLYAELPEDELEKLCR